MSKLEQLLKDFGIEFPEVINQITLYEILNKIADKWEDMQKDDGGIQQLSFESKCINKDACCCDCEEFINCKSTCYAYSFDCPNCPKKLFNKNFI